MFHRLDAQADSYRDTFTASTRARSLDVELVGKLVSIEPPIFAHPNY